MKITFLINVAPPCSLDNDNLGNNMSERDYKLAMMYLDRIEEVLNHIALKLGHVDMDTFFSQ